jgi:tripeptidyl-peptidase-1
VAAVGSNYLVWQDGPSTVDGTSCATPALAGMATLLNSRRLKAGKSSLGHLAPLLYHLAELSPETYFHDVVKGRNNCAQDCCSAVGYTAIPGWDGSTGLGTLNYTAIAQYIEQSLP